MTAPDVECNRVATAQARAAARGMTLRRIEGDEGPQFVATFHALARSFADIAEVELWLERVDGPRERRAVVDQTNREQDRRDEAVDLQRGPGGESRDA